jgi:L-amino acid N-acyltransferase YncA
MDYSKLDQFEDIGKKLDRWYDILWMKNKLSVK